MSRRQWIVRAFPRSWRARFGAGLTALLDDVEKEVGRIPAADRLDVAIAGLSERVASMRRPSRFHRALVACTLVLSVALAGTLAALESSSTPRALVSRPTTSTTHPQASPTRRSTPTPPESAYAKALAAQAAARAAEEAAAAAAARQAAIERAAGASTAPG